MIFPNAGGQLAAAAVLPASEQCRSTTSPCLVCVSVCGVRAEPHAQAVALSSGLLRLWRPGGRAGERSGSGHALTSLQRQLRRDLFLDLLEPRRSRRNGSASQALPRPHPAPRHLPVAGCNLSACASLVCDR